MRRVAIVYRMSAQAAPPKVAPPAGVPYIPQDPDSAFIVAIDLDTRKLDTLGSIRTPKSLISIRQSAEGFFSISQTISPLPTTDEWAVLPDGRGRAHSRTRLSHRLSEPRRHVDVVGQAAVRVAASHR